MKQKKKTYKKNKNTQSWPKTNNTERQKNIQ